MVTEDCIAERERERGGGGDGGERRKTVITRVLERCGEATHCKCL